MPEAGIAAERSVRRSSFPVRYSTFSTLTPSGSAAAASLSTRIASPPGPSPPWSPPPGRGEGCGPELGAGLSLGAPDGCASTTPGSAAAAASAPARATIASLRTRGWGAAMAR